ncbi:MAG: UDP-3-O-(3-hydroxymyristoyl)glucosamine N-acyltransferase [Elusimicrobia bacterium]|nr:UDP-3-O-(3-hydroxymyristoyl)glucosamine N-acyltransferase [Elusimicrobiota bacterium]
MKITSYDIAKIVEGQLIGNPAVVITGAAGLADAGCADVSFLGNAKYTALLETTKAGLLLLRANDNAFGKPHILVPDPQLAFAKILGEISNEIPSVTAGVHPTAVISPRATIGQRVAIGALVVIEDGAVIGDGTVIFAHGYIGRDTQIGADCIIYPQVTVRESCIIGKRVIIHAGAVVGADGFGFVPTKTGLYKIPQIGTVIIGDDVEIGANTTIDRGTTGATIIGKGTKIDNLVQIAHNVHIGNNCILVSQVGIAGSAIIGNGVTFGGQSGTVGHNTIGDGAVIAARGGVFGDVKAKEVVSGYPARPHREALKIQAILSKLPTLYKEIKEALKKE